MGGLSQPRPQFVAKTPFGITYDTFLNREPSVISVQSAIRSRSCTHFRTPSPSDVAHCSTSQSIYTVYFFSLGKTASASSGSNTRRGFTGRWQTKCVRFTADKRSLRGRRKCSDGSCSWTSEGRCLGSERGVSVAGGDNRELQSPPPATTKRIREKPVPDPRPILPHVSTAERLHRAPDTPVPPFSRGSGKIATVQTVMHDVLSLLRYPRQ